LRTIIGAPFSRSQARADAIEFSALYSHEGYANARIEMSVVELPKKNDDEQIRLVYSISDEGDKVFINQIIINGVTGAPPSNRRNVRRFLRALPFTTGDVLRADRISDAERNLYLTGRLPAGCNPFRTGWRKRRRL
jgi:outer membrane protein assembly factor BamA